MPTCFLPAQFLATPENASALAALRELLEAFTLGSYSDLPNPLFVHGPSGAGKSHLAQLFAAELAAAGFKICSLSANDFAAEIDPAAARAADLLVIDDLQHLPARFVEPLIAIIDDRTKCDQPMMFAATEGPGALTHRGTPLPRRLTNRLASGLVVKIEPLREPSRRRLLEVFANDAGLRLRPEILDWLAKNSRGGRELFGAISKLRVLQRSHKKPLNLADVVSSFETNDGPAVRQIAERVGACFQVSPKLLTSARRSRAIVLPRQVTMYLARRLTTMSLAQIGKYLGGRDHKTVRHACNKIETAMKKDAALSSAVRQLSAELS
jgi:chromosomal replication initiator protein